MLALLATDLGNFHQTADSFRVRARRREPIAMIGERAGAVRENVATLHLHNLSSTSLPGKLGEDQSDPDRLFNPRIRVLAQFKALIRSPGNT